MIPLDAPEEVAKILTEQAADIKRKILSLEQAQKDIELLKEEVLQMQTVDFKKYADIIVNLKMNNEFYWLIKNFDDQTLDHIRSRFDMESGTAFMDLFHSLNEKIFQLQKDNVPPDSSAGQAVAKAFWDMIMDFTQGDMRLFSKLIEFSNYVTDTSESGQKLSHTNAYIEKALNVYLTKLGFNPFAEEVK